MTMVKEWKIEQTARDKARAGLPFDATALDTMWETEVMPVINEYQDRVHASADLVLTQGAGHIIKAMHGRFHHATHTTHPDYHKALIDLDSV